MKRVGLSLVAAGMVLVPSAAADSQLYINGGTAIFDTGDASVNTFTARGGLAFHDLLGAELEASFGIGADDVDGTDFELESQFGGYLVARYPILPRLDAHGRVGFVTGEFQSATSGVSQDAEADGFAFGFGGELMITRSLGIRGDYTRINADDDQIDGGVNVFALTGVYKFGSVR